MARTDADWPKIRKILTTAFSAALRRSVVVSGDLAPDVVISPDPTGARAPIITVRWPLPEHEHGYATHRGYLRPAFGHCQDCWRTIIRLRVAATGQP